MYPPAKTAWKLWYKEQAAKKRIREGLKKKMIKDGLR